MPFAVAAVGAAATIGGALISSNAAKSAAQDQENAAMNATQAQMSMFNTTQGDYAGQIALGKQSSGLLSNLFGANGTPNYSSFDNSPGYQFSLQQGNSAINRNAAASGNLYSSNTLGALSAYNTGAAGQQYNSYVNQLTTMAGLGNAAAAGVGTAATATGGEIGNNANLAGSAAAAGTLGSANAFTNALGSNSMGNLMSNFGGFSGFGGNNAGVGSTFTNTGYLVDSGGTQLTDSGANSMLANL